nr:Wzz/FepE/Etk N-terminal domain-containing protein [Planctomycetota bacterium]
MTDPQHASVPPPPDAQEIPISQIFAILWRGRWIILLCALLATGAGVWYVEKRGTIYRAKARIKVDNQNLNVMGAEALFLGTASRNYANTQAELLRSTPILSNAIDRD